MSGILEQYRRVNVPTHTPDRPILAGLVQFNISVAGQSSLSSCTRAITKHQHTSCRGSSEFKLIPNWSGITCVTTLVVMLMTGWCGSLLIWRNSAPYRFAT